MEAMDTKAANELATGAPGSIQIGGKLYLAAQPTDADFIALRKYLSAAWAKKNERSLANVAAEIAALPKDLQALVGKDAINRAVDRTNGNKAPESGDLQEIFLDPANAAWWAWYLCRKNHPELELATVQAAINDDAKANDLLAALLTATSMKQLDPN